MTTTQTTAGERIVCQVVRTYDGRVRVVGPTFRCGPRPGDGVTTLRMRRDVPDQGAPVTAGERIVADDRDGWVDPDRRDCGTVVSVEPVGRYLTRDGREVPWDYASATFVIARIVVAWPDGHPLRPERVV